MFNTRREAAPMKVKEAVMRLKNENKTIRDMGQTSGSPTSAVWKIMKKKECSGRPRKTEESSKARPTDQNQSSGGRWVSVRDDYPQKTS